jgi:hypothetical protein
LSLTLTVAAAGTLYLVTLDAMALPMTRDAHVIADVAGHTALGIFFRLQVTDFDRLLGFFSLCHFIFPIYLFVWVDISIRAKSPLTGTKAEMVATFVVKPEAFVQPIISLIAETATPRLTKF